MASPKAIPNVLFGGYGHFVPKIISQWHPLNGQNVMFARTHPPNLPQIWGRFGVSGHCPVLSFVRPGPTTRDGKRRRKVEKERRKDKEKEKLIWKRNLGDVVG